MMQASLRGKAVLVTGAGGGIGRAIALAAAAAGGRVMAADIAEHRAQETAELSGPEARAAAIRVDVADLASIEAMVAGTVAKLGGIDVLVNSAGLTRVADIMDVTEADWDLIQGVNAKGSFFALQAAARQMIVQGQGGRIINIASISGQGYLHASSIAYSASKGAVLTLTRTAAQQLAKHDITVNAVNPGTTMTDLVRQILRERAADLGKSEESVMADLESSIPLGRAIAPEEIAAMVLYLAGPQAENITGQSFNVDGGQVMS